MDGKTRKIGHSIGLAWGNAEASRFFHSPANSWLGLDSFYLKEENVWNNILELTKVDFFLDFFFF